MSISKKSFGILKNGKEASIYTLRGKGGLSASVSDYGATLVSLLAPDKDGVFCDVVGGYDRLDDYINASGFQGATVGRFANRIGGACFELDGKEYRLAQNNNENHIHGGLEGFDKKIWKAQLHDFDEPSVTFSYVSRDMEEGYPGTLTVQVTYTVTEDNALSIHYQATTDKKTIINLTNHSYFNLGGYASGTVRDHLLTIHADRYVRTDKKLIPTGEIASVEGTPFDFRTEKTVGRDIDLPHPDLLNSGGYDHCFCFFDPSSEVLLRATLKDPKSGRIMKMYTNQPCVQLYTGNFLKDDGHPFKGGFVKSKQNTLCLETQHMPDSVHHKHFTDVTLDVGETYDYTTVYAFSSE